MRNLLILALLLYDIIALAVRNSNYDYDEVEASKRHGLGDERRNWRQKSLQKDQDPGKEWDDRRRHDFENTRFAEDIDTKFGMTMNRQREQDSYRNLQRRYEGGDKMSGKSGELGRSYMDKETEKKTISIPMSCDRPHERYEQCFSGCAAVTCDNPRERLRPCYPFCEAGCICLPPYVRDDRTHKCVMPDDCTKGLKGIPDIGEEN